MAKDTHCDELLEAKTLIRNKIYDTQEIVALVLDKPGITEDDTYYEEALDHILDYRYVDETVQQAGAWVMTEIEYNESYTAAMRIVDIYVEVLCSKRFMSLTNWTGIKGNRRDNILARVDVLLNGSREFGIGRLRLIGVTVGNVPNDFTSLCLHYQIPDFAADRAVGFHAD